MDQLFALGHVYTGTKILELALYEIMLARLRDGLKSILRPHNKAMAVPLVLAPLRSPAALRIINNSQFPKEKT
jgi:hypothetical protein